jgi:hypothetical protein
MLVITLFEELSIYCFKHIPVRVDVLEDVQKQTNMHILYIIFNVRPYTTNEITFLRKVSSLCNPQQMSFYPLHHHPTPPKKNEKI